MRRALQTTQAQEKIPALNEECAVCGKRYGQHQAGPMKKAHCPAGLQTRVGYINFAKTVFQPKKTTI